MCQTPMMCHSFHQEKLSNLTMEVEKTLGKMAADCQSSLGWHFKRLFDIK